MDLYANIEIERVDRFTLTKNSVDDYVCSESSVDNIRIVSDTISKSIVEDNIVDSTQSDE